MNTIFPGVIDRSVSSLTIGLMEGQTSVKRILGVDIGLNAAATSAIGTKLRKSGVFGMKPGDLERLMKICGMLGSNQDGERANAGKAATDLLKRLDLTWDEVLGKPPTVTAAKAQKPRARTNRSHRHRHKRGSGIPRSLIVSFDKFHPWPGPNRSKWLTARKSSKHKKVRRETNHVATSICMN